MGIWEKDSEQDYFKKKTQLLNVNIADFKGERKMKQKDEFAIYEPFGLKKQEYNEAYIEFDQKLRESTDILDLIHRLGLIDTGKLGLFSFWIGRLVMINEQMARKEK